MTSEDRRDLADIALKAMSESGLNGLLLAACGRFPHLHLPLSATELKRMDADETYRFGEMLAWFGQLVQGRALQMRLLVRSEVKAAKLPPHPKENPFSVLRKALQDLRGTALLRIGDVGGLTFDMDVCELVWCRNSRGVLLFRFYLAELENFFECLYKFSGSSDFQGRTTPSPCPDGQFPQQGREPAAPGAPGLQAMFDVLDHTATKMDPFREVEIGHSGNTRFLLTFLSRIKIKRAGSEEVFSLAEFQALLDSCMMFALPKVEGLLETPEAPAFSYSEDGHPQAWKELYDSLRRKEIPIGGLLLGRSGEFEFSLPRCPKPTERYTGRHIEIDTAFSKFQCINLKAAVHLASCLFRLLPSQGSSHQPALHSSDHEQRQEPFSPGGSGAPVSVAGLLERFSLRLKEECGKDDTRAVSEDLGFGYTGQGKAQIVLNGQGISRRGLERLFQALLSMALPPISSDACERLMRDLQSAEGFVDIGSAIHWIKHHEDGKIGEHGGLELVKSEGNIVFSSNYSFLTVTSLRNLLVILSRAPDPEEFPVPTIPVEEMLGKLKDAIVRAKDDPSSNWWEPFCALEEELEERLRSAAGSGG